MKLTVLCENTSRCALGCEHGLSLYIESGGTKLLFDTGQSGLFAENAAALGVDLSAVELCVISHGHYDHGGGLKTFLACNDRAPIYISPHAFEEHFNAAGEYNGLDPALKQSGRFVPVPEQREIAAGMRLYPALPQEPPRPIEAFGLGMLRGGEIVPDDFRHEQYLLIEEAGRRILISGCSHRGVLNIVSCFRPDVLVGGFHLFRLAPGERLREIGRLLDGADTDYYTCHCTGAEQYAVLRGEMRRLFYLSTGDSVEI